MPAIPHISYNRFAGSALALWLAATLAAGSARAQQPAWKTGAALRKQLDATVPSFLWQNQPLREGLEKLSRVYGVAVFLDRRIDPDQIMTLTAQDTPLEKIISKIAADAHSETAVMGPVVYVGPQGSAGQLPTLAALRRQEIARLPAEARAKLSRSEAWQWEELAQPRELLRDLARQVSLTVTNPQAVPHDLWPAVSLPPLPLTDRMTLLLAGFGLTFEIDPAATAMRIVSAPEKATVEKRYTPRGSAADLAAQLRRILPECELRVERGQLVAKGTQEDHDKIDRLLSGQSIRTTQPQKKAVGEKVYSLSVENEPAGNVINTVAKLLGKELKYEPAVLDKLKTPVTFNLKDVTLEILLESTLKPLGLTFRTSEKELEIVPATGR